MQRNRRQIPVLLAAAVVLVAILSPLQPHAGGDMKRHAPALIQSSYIVYKAVRQGKTIGHETITRRQMDNNTIEFLVESVASPAVQTKISQTMKMVIAEDTHFPRFYEVHKLYETPSQARRKFEHDITIEMISNVAVVSTKMGGRETVHRQVVPTGTAFIELNMVYQMEQFLFWYDDERGGVQTFDAMDVSSSKLESITLEYMRTDTLAVLGEDLTVDAYKVTRPIYEVTIFVDVDRRIVRMSQYQYDLELVEWFDNTEAELER